MNLFGLDFKTFKKRFEEFFLIEYASSHIRIRDKVSKNCIINVELPYIISESIEDLIKSLYIQIFKYVDNFNLRYDQDEFELYNHIRKELEYYNDCILGKRNKISEEFYSLVRDLAIDQSNNLYFKREPGIHVKMNLKSVEKMNKYLMYIEEEAIHHHKIIVQ